MAVLGVVGVEECGVLLIMISLTESELQLLKIIDEWMIDWKEGKGKGKG